jgi:hypothetical protein
MKRASVAVLGLLLVFGLSTAAYAGPGSVVIKTDGDITATFGAQVRMIPTYEQDWDFGIAKKNPAVTGNLVHVNEAGAVNKSYIRSEDRLYFNFKKSDIWDVYFALEFDDVLSSRTTDRVTDVTGAFGSFGLEKLNASVKLPWIYSRFNAGWDNNGVDIDLGALVYFDDDPGFYLKGGVANFGWYIAYDKKVEANRTLAAIRGGAAIPNIVNTGSDNDRDIVNARLDYTITKDTQVGLVFAWNHQHASTANFVTADTCVGPVCPETDGYYISPFVKASFAGLKLVGQYVHLWGDANKTNQLNGAPVSALNLLGPAGGAAGPKGNYEIDSNAAYADLSFDLTPWTGFRLIPHIGGWWTQGDKDATDNKLEGYAGATDFQRFSPAFGGENTIIADGNPVYGSGLYGFLPILKGNQTSNLAIGAGSSGNTGRGDNPGILIVGGGITVDPIKDWTYRTNAMYLRYQEDFCLNAATFAADPANPTKAKAVCAPTSSGAPNLITQRDAGVEWDNEVLWWLDKNMVVKGQFSFLFPLDGIKQITRALANNGQQPDNTAIRLAMEIIWNF